MRKRQIFTLIDDGEDRKLILSQLLTSKIRIPSLDVFKPGPILFEQLAAILKTLKPAYKSTLQKSYKSIIEISLVEYNRD